MENKTYEHTHYDAIDEICKVIKAKRKFYIIGHIRPDGDCIGTQLALYHFLTSLGKTVRAFNRGPISENTKFLKGIENIEPMYDLSFIPDVFIYVDTSSPDRVYNGFEPNGFIINIDHHYTNSNFGNINYIDTTVSAAGEQIFHILKHYNFAITPDIAECLYLAIVTDSGAFRYSTTTYKTFEIAAELTKYGAVPSKIATEFFDTISTPAVYLISQVLSNLHYVCNGKLCWSEITQSMFEIAGGEEYEPEGLVSKLRAIKGVEVGILLYEIKEGGIRVSLRSKGTINVGVLAEQLGGGGHPNASGIYIKGNYETLKNHIINETVNYIDKFFFTTD